MPRAIDPRSEGSLTSKPHPRRWTCKNQPRDIDVMSIDMLPGDILLDIFDFYVNARRWIEEWQTLVHVCQRWRSVAFGSPRRLNLRLFCSNKTPARDILDVWPALPLSIRCNGSTKGVDNIIAVLKRSDRVFQINLERIESWSLEEILAAMQEPFPELTHLHLWPNGETVSILPDSFLGGSVPRLEYLELNRIPFPGLPTLLLSATHLVSLSLYDIPYSGYFSSDAMATALSTLTRLNSLTLHFVSPPSQSRPDQSRQPPPPPTRSVLPALTLFWFKGVSEYLEVVVARIDAPRLHQFFITFFHDIVFDTPQFTQFIGCTPMLKPLEMAWVTFNDNAATVMLLSQTSGKDVEVNIPCRELDWQVSSMQQVCTSCLPPLPTLEYLYIHESPYWRQHWQGNIESALWLELLHPFTSVKNLHLSEHIARRIVPALQELVGGRTTEVLPALQNILLNEHQPSGPVQEGIQQIVSVRQAIGHPIAVSYGQVVSITVKGRPGSY